MWGLSLCKPYRVRFKLGPIQGAEGLLSASYVFFITLSLSLSGVKT